MILMDVGYSDFYDWASLASPGTSEAIAVSESISSHNLSNSSSILGITGGQFNGLGM